jgi:hypothetical protein
MARSNSSHALGAFHHAVAKGDLDFVKEFVQVKPFFDAMPDHMGALGSSFVLN